MNANLKSLPKSESADARAWVVRAGEEGETVEHNLDIGVVTIGWDEWPAPTRGRFKNRDTYGDYLVGELSDRDASSRQSARDQIWRFYHEVGVGDLVVLPLKNHGADDDWIAVGRVTGEASWDESRPKGALHDRRVRWLASTVPKSAAPETLQRSIDNTPRTVYGLNRDDKARWVQPLVDEFFDAPPDGAQDGDTDGSDRVSQPLSGDEAGVYDEHGEVVEGGQVLPRELRCSGTNATPRRVGHASTPMETNARSAVWTSETYTATSRRASFMFTTRRPCHRQLETGNTD